MGRQEERITRDGYLLLSPEQKIKERRLDDEVVDLVDTLLYKAIDAHASDIHLQPDGGQLRVRYRIDGVLHDQDPIPFLTSLQVLSRIKVLSHLDIAEKRFPQDGKFSVLVQRYQTNDQKNFAESIDLRVSTFPSTYGEKIVVRILDRATNLLQLESLGFSNELFEFIQQFMSKQHGFFLVTGPTGSGKTTTLYAMLSTLNRNEKNIVTMEDPVEYDLQGITQSQINLKTGFNFENGLRSMLRQDPDIIMIGEIRDRPTVQMAIESALTGHLVLSTLHTNDATGALTRLLDMGVEPFLINATLTGVLAQRLARKLCAHCKKEELLSPDEQSFLQRYGANIKKAYKPQGCSKCFNVGYKGRVGIFEFLVLDDQVRQLVMEKKSSEIIRDYAVSSGMKLLFFDAFSKFQQGIISFEEVLSLLNS